MTHETVIGVDVGGTFTDVVRWDGAELSTGKVSSTPADQSIGVVDAARGLGGADRFFHGTTVATNAVLENRTAVTALVTSSGFSDIIEIGRQDRPSLYDTFADRAAPLVRRDLRFEADDLDRWEPPPGMEAPEAVAIALVRGYDRPEAEEAIASAIGGRWPDTHVSAGSKVAAEFREFERTATTVLNASLAPEVRRYLQGLTRRAGAIGLPEDVLVMRSSGGLLPISEAMSLPAAILLSGPAGGVMAAAALGRAVGVDRLVSFDMGGTSTDVCRIEDGRPEVTYERDIQGRPCRMPSVAIHTVGAGGGSLAWRDGGGSLRVGPRSAGAVPGPAGYGLGGTDPAVTDADIVLGRIAPDALLAGTLRVRPDLAARAVAGLAAHLGLDIAETAHGIVEVVDEVMGGAIRKVSVEEGADPREAMLLAFGGAGGLHAGALAKRLGMAGVLVPLHAGAFSAIGLLVSPPRIDVALSRLLGVEALDLDAVVSATRDTATERFVSAIGAAPVEVATRIDMRYLGQSHEVSIGFEPGASRTDLADRFHREHRERNGFSRPGDPVEIVTVRATAIGRPAVDLDEIPVPAPSGPVQVGERRVMTRVGVVERRRRPEERVGGG